MLKKRDALAIHFTREFMQFPTAFVQNERKIVSAWDWTQFDDFVLC